MGNPVVVKNDGCDSRGPWLDQEDFDKTREILQAVQDIALSEVGKKDEPITCMNIDLAHMAIVRLIKGIIAKSQKKVT